MFDMITHLQPRARFLGGKEIRVHILLFSKATIFCCIASLHLGLATASENRVGSIYAVTNARKYRCEGENLS